MEAPGDRCKRKKTLKSGAAVDQLRKRNFVWCFYFKKKFETSQFYIHGVARSTTFGSDNSPVHKNPKSIFNIHSIIKLSLFINPPHRPFTLPDAERRCPFMLMMFRVTFKEKRFVFITIRCWSSLWFHLWLCLWITLRWLKGLRLGFGLAFVKMQNFCTFIAFEVYSET